MITRFEQERRQRAIDFARGNVRLEGVVLDAELERLNAAYIAGELSDEEHTRACLAHIRNKVPSGA